MNTEKILPAATRALFDSDLVATRIILALAEWLWAILLLWPGDTFGRPTYKMMAHVMTEEAWALTFLLMASLQTTIVLTESFHNVYARAFAGLNAAIWVFIVVSMLLSVYPPPAAISGEIALALGATWVWLRPIIEMRGIVNVRQKRA
jgi:hypothetical protein